MGPGRQKVVRFWRGARRHPAWDLGTPPGAPRRRRRRLRARPIWAAAVVGLLLLGPPVADVANGLVKPHEGCRVIGVVDGDTVRLFCPAGGLVSGRLLGFDTPELSPPRCATELARGMASTFYLRWRLWAAGRIAALPLGQDRYGRTLVDLSVDGAPMARVMIARGLARPYSGGPRRSWCD